MCGSVALISDGNCLYEQSLLSKKTHSKRLLPAIEQAMIETELNWNGLDGLAVSIGPGSFTGIRIGLTTIKAIAMATGLPLMGIASLDGLASQFAHSQLQICPILDARKNEVYTALFQDQNGSMSRISEYMVLAAERLCQKITIPTLFVGDGVAPYRDLIKEILAELAIFAPAQLHFPRAAAIGQLAIKKYQQADFIDPATAVPIYIRPSEAEINYKKKN